MKHSCIAAEDAGRVSALPADNAQRLGCEACVRCREVLDAYALFKSEAIVDGVDIERADVQLSAFVASTVHGDADGRASAAEPARPRPGFWQALAHRPAWALAAAAIVVTAILFAWQPWQQPDPLMRSGPWASIVVEIVQGADGGVHVRWQPVSHADAYEVRVFSDDLGAETRLDERRRRF